jgi:hypothetical protein
MKLTYVIAPLSIILISGALFWNTPHDSSQHDSALLNKVELISTKMDSPLENSSSLQNTGPLSTALPLQYTGSVLQNMFLLPSLPSSQEVPQEFGPVIITRNLPSHSQFAYENNSEDAYNTLPNINQQSYTNTTKTTMLPPVIYNSPPQRSLSPN